MQTVSLPSTLANFNNFWPVANYTNASHTTRCKLDQLTPLETITTDPNACYTNKIPYQYHHHHHHHYHHHRHRHRQAQVLHLHPIIPSYLFGHAVQKRVKIGEVFHIFYKIVQFQFTPQQYVQELPAEDARSKILRLVPQNIFKGKSSFWTQDGTQWRKDAPM